MDVWRPITEQPPINVSVLVTDGTRISIGSWGGYTRLTSPAKGSLSWFLDTDPCGISCHREDEGIDDTHILYWMPLPGLPGVSLSSV